MFQRLVVNRLARLGGRFLHHLFERGGIERRCQVRVRIGEGLQPARIAPAGSLLRAFLIAHFGQEIVVFVTHLQATFRAVARSA